MRKPPSGPRFAPLFAVALLLAACGAEDTLDGASSAEFYGTGATPWWIGQPANQAGAAFGTTAATAGDVNGDGYADVIVGAPYFDGIGYSNEGKAWLYSGAAGGIGTTPTWELDPIDQADANFGFAVAGVGDVNADGFDDVAIGCRLCNVDQPGEGRVYVYYGSAGGLGSAPLLLDPTAQTNAGFGSAVAAAGDVNGDGFADVIAGAPNWDGAAVNEGRAWVYLGGPLGLEAVPAWEVSAAAEAGARFGFSVGSAGDTDADGDCEILVGAPYWGPADEGKAWLFAGGPFGPALVASWTQDPSDQDYAYFGWSVSGAGDVDADGDAEIAIGAPGWNGSPTLAGEGRVYVYGGTAGGATAAAIAVLDGADQAGAGFGSSIFGAGDGNGDGYGDLAVGAPGFDGGGIDEGRIYFYGGQGAALLALLQSVDVSDEANARFGASIAHAGDTDRDGFADVIAGAPGASGDVASEGKAWVLRGVAQGLWNPSTTIIGPTTSSQLGTAVAYAGDVNGDGYGDVLIGQRYFGTGTTPSEGRAFLHYGTATGIGGAAWISDPTDQSYAYYGNSLAGLGDVNGDGFADFAVAAYQYDGPAGSDAGRVYVYHGSAAGPVFAVSIDGTFGGWLGNSIAGPGDVNADGYGDLLVGNPYWGGGGIGGEGRILLYLGGAAGISATATWTTDPTNFATAHFGEVVAAAGDVNGDGWPDLLASAPTLNSVYLFLGGPAMPVTAAWSASGTNSFGLAIAGAGDVNGDGRADVIVGHPSFSSATVSIEGRGYVYHGTATGLAASPALTVDPTDQSGAYFAYAVSSAGDMDGDGYAEVAFGAQQWTGPGGGSQGRVYLYRGGPSGAGGTPITQNPANKAAATYGSSVAGGDLNGDGFGDLVAGSPGWDVGMLFSYCCEEGRVDVHLGGDFAPGLPRRQEQFRAGGTVKIGIGGGAGGTSVVLKARAMQEIFAGGSLRLEFEVKPIGTPFNGLSTQLSPPLIEGAIGQVTVSGLADGAGFHWRSRVVNAIGLGGGHWTPFGGNGEADADFRVPALTNGSACAAALQCASGWCTDGVCCNAACGGGAATDCQACSIAAGGSTDGVCGPREPGLTCRAAVGPCDAAESCDGLSTVCPPDGYAAFGTTCRAASGACDVAETCSGASSACPPNGYASSATTCRASAGPCDLAESCTGTGPSCPTDGFAAASVTCRAASGVCDAAETCTGSGASCPADGFAASSVTCRTAAGPCDLAETCSGSSASCPADGFAASSVTCRVASGLCDVAETCSGSSAACPADGFAGTSVVCRSSAGVCDAAESCTGTSASCPANGFFGSSVTCRAAAGPCDLAESCTGTSASCPVDGFAAATVVCRAAAGVCDVADTCTGSSASCPADAFAPTATVCRAASGICDPAESCTGSAASCPIDAFAPPLTICRPAVTACDSAESCPGTGAACPTDAFAPPSTICRAASGVCDSAESCTGSGTICPPDGYLSAITCRSSAGPCDAPELCDGSAPLCPADAPRPDGTLCSDGLPCDGVEICTAGTCASPAPLDCDDLDACTGDVCADPIGCSHLPVGGCCNVAADCDDGDACTADACSGPGGTCSHTPAASCCNVDPDCDDGELCTVDTCSGAGGTCANDPISECCDADADCDDGALCTADSCDLAANYCLHGGILGCCNADGDCADTNACTADSCNEPTGICANDAIPACCNGNADCDDGDPCTIDDCTSGACTHTPDPACVDAGVPDAAPDASLDAGADAGTDAAVDADQGPDADLTPPGPSGCDCRAGAASPAGGPPTPALLLLLLLALPLFLLLLPFRRR